MDEARIWRTLQALLKEPAVYPFEFRQGNGGLRPVLMPSTCPVDRLELQLLAMRGLVGRAVRRNGPREPRGYSETYTVTALGRREAGVEGARKPERHRGTTPAFDFDNEESEP